MDGREITIYDLMGVKHPETGVTPAKDAESMIEQWLDAREKEANAVVADNPATGEVITSEETVANLANKYRVKHSKVKTCGNAITRSCAYTGAFVVLNDGRTRLWKECPG